MRIRRAGRNKDEAELFEEETGMSGSSKVNASMTDHSLGGEVSGQTAGRLSRRELLRLAGAAGAGLGAPFLQGCAGQVVRKKQMSNAWMTSSQLWGLGVASGYPSPHGVVLWTRLVADHGELDDVIPVQWEVAHDQTFTQIAAKGTADAVAQLGHSVHVEVGGLAPDRPYFYRFRYRDNRSETGLTRTAPAANQLVSSLRLVLASCQNWQHGYFHAWSHAAREAPHLIMFVGDYIYEGGASKGPFGSGPRDLVRAHDSAEVMTLEHYRKRYALYKSDRHLRTAHQAAPWVCTWDDHEVANDYAADRDAHERPEFLKRRAAAYQAYWEHMPLPIATLQRALLPSMQIYTRLQWGRLAGIHMLDDRQYRDYPACASAGAATPWLHECPELSDEKRSLLGRKQEAWLAEGLKQSNAHWTLIGQQTLMAETNQANAADARAGKARYWTDGWNGYRPARERFYQDLANAQKVGRARDTLVLSGDVHAWYIANLKSQADIAKHGERAPVLATEFCGTSITSMSWPQERAAQMAELNSQYCYARSDRRGYTLFEITPSATQVSLRSVTNPKLPESTIETLATFDVLRGQPGTVLK
jgi:alkaline phosphatase D